MIDINSNSYYYRFMRYSQQREAIKTVLAGHKDHPVAEQIYREVKDLIPNVSLGTVYRNLNLLSEKGEILVLEVPGGAKRYDPTVGAHQHFICISCGKVEDVPFMIKTDTDSGNIFWSKRTLSGVQVVITGFCEDCGEKS